MIEKHRDAFVVITSKYYWNEMQKQLLKEGFKSEQLFLFGEIISEIEERIYFDLPELPHLQHEIFIDGGGYDGMSTVNFCKWAAGSWEVKIFEPEKKLQEKCQSNVVNIDHVEIIPNGLWNKKEILPFVYEGSASRIVDNANGSGKISVISLDEYLQNKPVTFIKMDIEGSELNAIKGAEKTICKYKPKLAISIYHKPEDLIELPKLLLSFNNNYKFWLRHYSLSWFDTVLYAV